MTIQRSFYDRLSNLPWTTAILVGAAFIGGCASPAPVIDPFAGLREARTRAQVEKQASRDPFPTPSDVGLK
jgi:hypothetical protein